MIKIRYIWNVTGKRRMDQEITGHRVHPQMDKMEIRVKVLAFTPEPVAVHRQRNKRQWQIQPGQRHLLRRFLCRITIPVRLFLPWNPMLGPTSPEAFPYLTSRRQRDPLWCLRTVTRVHQLPIPNDQDWRETWVVRKPFESMWSIISFTLEFTKIIIRSTRARFYPRVSLRNNEIKYFPVTSTYVLWYDEVFHSTFGGFYETTRTWRGRSE